MKTSYDGYNEKLNKIYFNPYYHTGNGYQGQVPSLRILDSPADDYGLSVSQQKLGNGLRDGPGREEVAGTGRGRPNRNMRLSASQIFSKGWDAGEGDSGFDKPKKQQQGPVINYFVTEFQRLQAENKTLQAKLLEYQKGNSTQPSILTPSESPSTPTLMPNPLLSQNQALRSQLQQQQKLNKTKNQQISQLVNKITEIEHQVKLITKNNSLEDREQMLVERERAQQEEYREMVREIEQRRGELDREVQGRRRDMEREVEESRREMEERRKVMEREMEERIKMMENERNTKLKQVQLLRARLQKQTAQKIQLIQSQTSSKLHQQQLHHKASTQKTQQQLHKSLEALYIQYPPQSATRHSLALLERIAQLQAQLEQLVNQYRSLEEEVNNIRYVPKLK